MVQRPLPCSEKSTGSRILDSFSMGHFTISLLNAHDRAGRVLNDPIGMRAQAPQRRLERAASDKNQVGPLLPGLLSHGIRNVADGDPHWCVNAGRLLLEHRCSPAPHLAPVPEVLFHRQCKPVADPGNHVEQLKTCSHLLTKLDGPLHEPRCRWEFHRQRTESFSGHFAIAAPPHE